MCHLYTMDNVIVVMLARPSPYYSLNFLERWREHMKLGDHVKEICYYYAQVQRASASQPHTTLNMVLSVIWYFMVAFWMILLINNWTNTIMDIGCVHLLAKTLLSLGSNLWWDVVMDDWKLDEQPLGKW